MPKLGKSKPLRSWVPVPKVADVIPEYSWTSE